MPVNLKTRLDNLVTTLANKMSGFSNWVEAEFLDVWTNLQAVSEAIPTSTSELDNDSGFITASDVGNIKQDNKVRVIYIDPESLPADYNKADVVNYLNTNGFSKGDIETLIIQVGSSEAPPMWTIDVVEAYEARVLADYGVVEDKAALKSYLEQ